MDATAFAEIVASFLVVGLALGVVWAVPKIPKLAFLDPSLDHGGRVSSIDGLRGFLALGVVISHALSYRQQYRVHRWDWPPNPFFTFTGVVAVALFFAITGYLFWGQAIAGKATAGRLYPRRFWRIYPLYAALVLTAFGICFAAGGGSGRAAPPSGTTLAKLAVPGLFPSGEVYGTQIGLMITQTWTLAYEVAFYLALPALAFLARKPSTSYGLIVAVLALRLVAGRLGLPLDPATQICYFAIGMLARQLQLSGALREPMLSRAAAGAVVASFVAMAALPPKLSALRLPLVFVAFLPIAYGNDLFGFLSRRSCKMLGDVSYSIYMWHLVVFFLLLGAIDPRRSIATMPEVGYWLLTAFGVCLVVLISLLSYRVFEKPFLSGKPAFPRAASVSETA